MKDADYAQILSPVWLIVSLVADGWLSVVALVIAVIWAVVWLLANYVEHRDRKTASRIETWRR